MSTEEQRKFVDVGSLPEDPLSMPPPHWRSSGAVFHVRVALKTTVGLLRRLVPVYAETDARLEVYFAAHPGEPTEDDHDEFGYLRQALAAGAQD